MAKKRKPSPRKRGITDSDIVSESLRRGEQAQALKERAQALLAEAPTASELVEQCVAVHGVAATVVAICQLMNNDKKYGAFAQRLGGSLERYIKIAEEVDKEHYNNE